MYVPYNQISHNARVWIYQSDRAFTSIEREDIESQLTNLCNNWNNHGKELHCSYQIHDWFICLFVDECKQIASGCSIDSSVAVIKAISDKYKIDFFDRMNIAFLDGEITKILPLSEFKKLLTPQTVVYNNLVSTKSEYESKWKVPLSESWLARFAD